MRRVALVSDAAGIGGAELYLEALVSTLQGRCRFHAILGDRAPAEVDERLAGAGASVERITGLRRIPRPTAPLRLRSRLRELAPELVHVNLTDQGDGIGTVVAARLSGRPTLCTLHLVIPERTRAREAVSRQVLALPRALICVSEAVALYARTATPRIDVVRPGVAEPRLAPEARRALGLEEDAFVVGGIGRLHDQKGWDVLCSAARQIRAGVQGARLVVIGDGPERERLAAQAARADVTFAGHRKEASSLLGAFDVLVVPSRYEALGLVAVEAMYAGVPVIASDVGGLPEAIGDAGVLVSAERPDLLAEAVIALANDPRRRAQYGERGAARARALFTPQRMAEETLAVYEELLR